MKKLLLALALIVFSFAYIVLTGSTYVAHIPKYADGSEVQVVQDHDVIRVEDSWEDDEYVYIKLRSVGRGGAEINLDFGERGLGIRKFYVHSFGIITEDSRIGKCTGGYIILISVNVFLAFVLIDTIKKYRKNLKDDLYSYRNVSLLGITIYIGYMMINTLLGLSFSPNGLAESISIILSASDSFAFWAIPIAFIAMIVVGISNIRLIRREGKSRVNILGTVFCFGSCVMLLIPRIVDEWFQRTSVIDVHREAGWGNLLNQALVNMNASVLTYFLCILAGTIIMGGVVTKRTPERPIDYIIILGCQIRKDGTLPPLLKGRADSAVSFAEKQKSSSGKDVIFVPSGGQGPDEIIPEGEAIGKYLESCGVSPDHILVEDKSTNTLENFRFSLEKIREEKGDETPSIAFATTNYHVLRSGMFAKRLGLNAFGIGAKTKLYFSINAFIRECIATLYYEKKIHIKVLIVVVLLTLLMVGFAFMSIII